MERNLSAYSDTELFTLMRGTGTEARDAFRELYTRHATRVFTYCRRIVERSEVAEDVFQETFTRLYLSAQQERTMTNVAAFLLRIARNLCLNARANKHFSLVTLEDFLMPVYDRSYEEQEVIHLIGMALEQLAEELREVFVLREYNDLSYEQIAEVLGVTTATVRIRLYRARQRLRRILTPYFEDHFH